MKLKVKFNDIFFSDVKRQILHVDGLEIEGVHFGTFTCNINDPKDIFLIRLTTLLDVPSRIKTDDEVIKEIQDLVQAHINSIAKEKNYENGFALANYSESTNETFRAEALKFIPFRDQCWVKCYEILDLYQSGQIDRPEPEDVVNQLPEFSWDEENQDERRTQHNVP